MKWNPTLYDCNHTFVAEYGRGLLELVPKNPAQSILDLGCGTGTLTVQLEALGSRVVGIDQSKDMVSKAVAQYPHIEFMVCDALNMPFEREWDVVFSNAVFHWICDHDKLLQNIYKALRPRGMLICEFGAIGNISIIEHAFEEAYKEFGYDYYSQFNFSSPELFSFLLQKHGFVVDQIYDYERPTELQDGEYGLSNWLQQFFAPALSLMSEPEKMLLIKSIEDKTKPVLWNGHSWIADYRRLKVIAHTR